MIYNIYSTSITGFQYFQVYQYFAIYRWYYLLKFEEFSWISCTKLFKIRRYQTP